jgi:hypothetical protein
MPGGIYGQKINGRFLEGKEKEFLSKEQSDFYLPYCNELGQSQEPPYPRGAGVILLRFCISFSFNVKQSTCMHVFCLKLYVSLCSSCGFIIVEYFWKY